MHHEPVQRFGVVIPGVLYRSGQPDEKGWQFLKDKWGIRTVIDLREDTPNEPWAVLERQFCARNGIRHVKLPIGHGGLTDEQLRLIVETISDPQRQPVLVHCKLGRSRTGITVAAYRVVAQGWSYNAALAESQRYKGHMNPPYAAYLKRLAEGYGWRPAVPPAIGRAFPAGYPVEVTTDVR
ncbi:MAG: tyrosine-protein phosphatase [Phycisphaerae bacterium]|nr:tyrosine-protein phosphatase [Phycisphaerae bacterium]